MSFNVSQHVKDKETYGGQAQPVRDVTPFQTDQGINLSELARQAAAEEEERRRREEETRRAAEEARRKTLTTERNSLIEKYKNLGNPNYLKTAAERNAYVKNRNDILDQLKKYNEALGLDESDYINLGDRIEKTVTGATKQSGSGFLNFLGTGVAYLRDLANRIGGNTNPYAGYATDEVSAANIGYEHDDSFYNDAQQMSDRVQAAADRISESASEDLRVAKAGLGNVGSAVVDIGANLIQMGYDAAIGAVTGGGSLASMFVRSAGSQAQEVRQAGGSTAQQFWAGAASGGIEVLTEKMADGLAGIYGKGSADDVIERVIGRLSKSDFGRTVLRQLAGAASEGVEEVTSDLLNPFVQIIYNNKTLLETAKDSYNLSDMLYDFIIGAAVGAIGGSASLVVDEQGNINPSNSQNVQANQQLRYTDEARNALIDRGFDQRTAQRQAENIAIQMMDGQLTDAQQRDFNRYPTAAEVFEQMRTNRSTERTQTEEESRENTEQTARTYVEQTVEDLDVPEQAAQILLSGYETGDANAQDYVQGIKEAFKAGQLGVDYEQARQDAVFGQKLNDLQYRHAYQIGAQKAGLTPNLPALPATSEANTETATPSYGSIEEFSSTFSSPEQVTQIYDQTPETDLNVFQRDFQRAYDMGQSGVSASYLNDQTIPGLTADQRQAAYQMGQSAATTQATSRDTRIAQNRKTGNLNRAKGTVKGEGVTIADMRAAFNDSQNTAYRLLTRYAETTGVNIVLYNSQADSRTGMFPEAQGRFQWRDNAIYVDINSGLNNINDVNDLGKYTMLRTFAHEFTHFIEKWNPTRYNEFRQFVFQTLEAKGENVNDLIESMQMRDNSGKMTYEQASREVVADAMMDILPDSTLVQQLAQEHQTIFQQLLKRLRDFAARMRQYYNQISTRAPREAQALKENNSYMKSIVDMWDSIAKGAVENYQQTVGEEFLDQPAKPENLPRQNAQQKRNNAQIREENAQNQEKVPAPAANMPAQTEKQQAGMDFFRPVDVAEEETPNLVREATKWNQPVNRDRFPANDFTSQAEAGPDLKNMVPRRAEPVEERTEPINERTETAEPETPDVRAEEGNRSDGAGTVRVSPELQEEPVRGNAAEGNTDSVPSEEGNGTGRNGDRPDAGRDGRIGSEGTGESGVQPGRSELSEKAEAPEEEPPKVKKKRQKKLKETVEHDVAQKSTEKPGGNNFEIGDSLDLENGSKTRYKTNVEAIRIVKLCEAENRNATPEEQAVLSKYVGWGGLSQAFDRRNSEWSKEYEELKALLTDEEYRAASKSTQNAHYTSIEVIKAMYQGLQKLGYKGGMMLEPSCGTGNFVGAMPAEMRGGLKGWTMVELDSLTSRIARLLYPQSDVRNEGFQNSVIPNNSIDVAIGNVPFSNVGVYDRAYPKRLTSSLHNYFFVKTLDKVRPGGLVMFITSSGTMSSSNAQFREYFAKKADLLGAIRLPETAFKGNAGTEVVTDILIFKKRAEGTEYSGEAFIKADYDYSKDAYINEYFKAHPEMVLGRETKGGSMYRRNSYTVEAYTDRGTLGEQIEKAFDSITGKMEYPVKESPEKTNFKVQRESKKAKQGSYVQKEGKLYQHNGSTLNEVQTDEKTAKKISGMVTVREWARELMNAQQQGASTESIKALRESLNKAYDDFVKENGCLNSAANRKAFADDPDKYSLFALEKNFKREKVTSKSKNGKTKTSYVETAEKADIFTENTIQPNRTITHADSVAEGLIVSRNTTGGVDAALIAKLTGKSQDDVVRELIEGEMAFKNSDGNLEPAEVYLSGNVRAKLRDAKTRVGFDKDYQHNIDALTKIIPADVPHEQIFVQVGSPWIPADVYADFAAHMLGGYNSEWRTAVKVVRSPETGQFKVQLLDKYLKDRSQNKQVWGTKYNRKTFLDIFEATLNSKSLTVTMKDADGKTYVDQVATAEVNDKVEKINKEFARWLWEEESRTKDLEYLYNETFNAIVTPSYDGSTLTVNGLRAGYSLMPHQANAVQRVISSGGNTLLAHKVGAGKTMEMAAAAMKLKELGIINKPMFTVPKSLVAQWGKEFSNFFPTAKLLVAEEGDFTEANRKTFANRIATGNYDAIIVSYEQFAKIPISNSFAQGIYQEQIDDIVRSIEEAKEELGERYSVKQMEKKKDSLQKKIDELSDIKKDENTIEFEQLGIDALFVDEAHNFKNLFYSSSMTNIAGLGNRDGAKRSFDLYTKTRYLQQLNGGRGIVFATATPVMNSMSEMYIMQKYLQPDLLKQLGLSSFDAWAKQFGEVVNAMEIKPSGQGYRVKQSFSRFKNLNELQMLFRGFSDVLTKIPGLKIPKMKGGSAQYIECEPGEFQQEYMKKLEERANNIKHVDPREDNMLKITSDGRKVSYTQRMIDPSLPYEEGCKVYRCADKVVEVYKESNDFLGTQIVFCDMATPKGKSNSEKEKGSAEEEEEIDADSAKLYEDMKARMVKGGIPANEIAFIHDAKTDAQKTELFEAMNEGKIRVLIGSTGKMGVGMNAQKRAYAIHHLDAPWRPGDVEQRNGRVFRQKNMNDEAYCFIYYTKKSFDSRLWDILKRKQGFIDQIMNGENIGREAEDTGEITISAAEIAALASDNPLIKEQFELEVDLKRLGNLQMAHNQAVFEARKKQQQLIQQKAELEQRIENGRKDLKSRKKEYTDDDFKMKIGSTTFTDRKKAGEAIYVEALAKTKVGEGYTKIGTFAGFDILAMRSEAEMRGMLRGAQGYTFPIYDSQKTLTITRMQQNVEGLENYIKERETRLADTAKEIQTQEKIMSSPFEEQEELDRIRNRYNEVMEILNPKEEQVIGDGEDIKEESTRRETISNRELLGIAAQTLDDSKFTAAEKDALRIFQERAGRLQMMQMAREDLGKQYKEQQFGKGGSRAEAEQTYSAMKTLDTKIKALENNLLSLENKEVLKRVLEKARNIVETQERERGSERLRQYRERRNESEAVRMNRARVKTEAETLRKWLINPSSKDVRQHVPAELQKTVADFLDSINFASQTALRTGGAEITKADERYLKNMKKMHDAIKHNVDARGAYSGYADLPEDFLETFEKLIRAAEGHISGNSGTFVINQMTARELNDLYHVLKTLRKYITTMNVFHNNAMFQHASDAAEETIDHLKKFEKSKKSGAIYKFLRFDYMRPSYAFEHFGKGGQSIEHEFREGQATQAFLANKIIDFAKKTYTGKEVREWSKETKTFELDNGENITLPITHIMSLYALNKRPQALTHIYGDGIRVANYKQGGTVQLDEGHIVSLSDVQRMIDSLSDRQRAVADALQKFMSTETAKWGNYVSMARFDVEQFTEETYFPINSDGRYLSNTADESPDNASLYALLNSSFTKELKEGADNRIILYNVFDVFANHTASMTQYRAFALPVLDALKWFNYKNDTTSVRTKMSSAFGAPVDERAGSGSKGYAEQFVINLLKAYNGTAAQGDPYDSLPLKMLHHFNGAAIAYNLRVVIQQPTAITRAAMILSPSKLMKGLSMSATQMRKLAEEMEQYSGIAAWKALGFYDTNISRGLTELIKQDPGKLDQVMEIGTKGAEFADRFTWAAMWYAAKDSVDKSKYKTNDEYMKAVTELFEDVIYKTQVVDSLLTKAEFLRSKGGIARQMGSFMSEPSATMSMLADAYFKYTDDMQQGMSRSEAWQRNGKNIAKTAAVYAVGQVILSAMQAVIDAWRDQDDEDSENWLKNYIQKYLNAFKSNVIEEELIFGKIPYVSELYELMKGYLDKFGVFDKLGLDIYGNDTASGLAMYTKYLSKAMEIIAGKVTGDSKYNNYTDYGIIYNLIRAASNLSGIPFATAWREVQDIWNNTVGYFNPSKKLVTYQRAVDRTYNEQIQQTGLGKSTFQNILNDADTVHGDGNGSIKQDELGAALVTALEEGKITEEQAQAVWNTKGWKKTFDGWRGLGSDIKTETTAEKSTKAPAATTTPAAGSVRSYDDFKKVPVYDSAAKQALFNVWESSLKPSGMSLDRFAEIITKADTDGNDSLKQDEMGTALLTAMQKGELTFDQCDAIWRTQWNKARSKTFAKWLNG